MDPLKNDTSANRISFSVDGAKALYREFIDNNDPRTQHWPLVHTPWPGLVLTALYVYVVKVAGPQYMQNREPFNIRPLLIVYNFGMVALSAWMFYEVAWVTYVYFLSKYLEFMDTIFFVLRKKFNQISFLHVFHHVVMSLNIWLLVHFGAGDHGTFHALINSAVHFVMYGYYALAAIGPGMQKYLWWKRYLTQVQMAQFVVVSLHSAQVFFWTDCAYPKWAATLFSAYPTAFLFLFAKFYLQSYTKKLMRRSISSAKRAWSRDPVIGGVQSASLREQHKNGATLSGNSFVKRRLVNGNMVAAANEEKNEF